MTFGQGNLGFVLVGVFVHMTVMALFGLLPILFGSSERLVQDEVLLMRIEKYL